MLDVLHFFPRWLIVCKNRLEVEETKPDVWQTYCPSAYECYGCDGQIRMEHPRNPTGYIEIDSFDIYGTMPTDTLYMSDEYITEKVQKYIDSDEQYWMIRDIRCDVDTVIIYEWNEPKT